MIASSEQFKSWLANRSSPLCVGIAGGSGSGKTTLAELLHEYGGLEHSILLLQDSYYRDQSHLFDEDGGKVNFDHPSSLDFPLLAQHLETLRNGKPIEMPIYDFSTHKRLTRTIPVQPKPLIIVDGILILDSEIVRTKFDHSIFVTAKEETRFKRRLERDVRERGRTPDGVEKQFLKQVKPMHDQFVEPSQKHAHFLANGEAWLMPSFEAMVNDLWNRAKTL